MYELLNNGHDSTNTLGLRYKMLSALHNTERDWLSILEDTDNELETRGWRLIICNRINCYLNWKFALMAQNNFLDFLHLVVSPRFISMIRILLAPECVLSIWWDAKYISTFSKVVLCYYRSFLLDSTYQPILI